MDPRPIFDGGSDAERARVLEQHQAYLEANATFDWQALAGIWSKDPTGVFFNLNGHTYVGRDHWTRLWQYYRDRLETGRWIPYDIKVIIRGELAVVTCHRKTRLRWIGAEPAPPGFAERTFVSRSTMVFARQDGNWQVVHVHFSEASEGPRPGNI